MCLDTPLPPYIRKNGYFLKYFELFFEQSGLSSSPCNTTNTFPYVFFMFEVSSLGKCCEKLSFFWGTLYN